MKYAFLVGGLLVIIALIVLSGDETTDGTFGYVISGQPDEYVAACCTIEGTNKTCYANQCADCLDVCAFYNQ